MADTFRESRLGGGARHRVDEIHVHHRRRPTGLLIGLLALLAIGLFALWAARRNRATIPAPDVNIPRMEKPSLERPAMPAVPEAPEVAPPAPEMAAPEMTPPAEPEPAAPEVAPPVAPVEPSEEGAAEPEGAAAEPEGAAAEPGAAAATGEDCSKAAVLHFSTNATSLRGAEMTKVTKIAECLKADPEQTARLEGSADPRGDDEHNRNLALSRAQMVKKQLIDQGVKESQLSIVVRAGECAEDNEACWQKDRTVTVVASKR